MYYSRVLVTLGTGKEWTKQERNLKPKYSASLLHHLHIALPYPWGEYRVYRKDADQLPGMAMVLQDTKLLFLLSQTTSGTTLFSTCSAWLVPEPSFLGLGRQRSGWPFSIQQMVALSGIHRASCGICALPFKPHRRSWRPHNVDAWSAGYALLQARLAAPLMVSWSHVEVRQQMA